MIAMTAQERMNCQSIQGRVHSHETMGTVDGPGIRYVVFLQGCPLRCLYCHNPDSISFQGGEVWTAGDLCEEILRYRNYIKSGGVTLSGGEPLAQKEFVIALIQLLHEEGIHVAVDTSGCFPVKEVKEVLQLADLLLLDIKAVDPAMAKAISGQDNQNAFAILDYCESIEKPVWIRQVILKNYTLDEQQMEILAKKLSSYHCIEKIELLPFHKMGEHKWALLHRSYQLQDIPATSKKEIQAMRSILQKYHLPIH